MMGIFTKLKLIFKRTKKDDKKQEIKQENTTPPASPLPQESAVQEPIQTQSEQPIIEKKIEPAPFDANSTGPHRDSRSCPKCGAPNDPGFHKCWLCKSEI